MSDLIDREAALQAIKCSELGMEYDAIEALPTIPAPRWVRCEERLPSRKNKVIIVDGFGQVDVAKLTDEGWQLPYGVIDVGRAKWWMPIEPPKEGE